MIVEEKEVEIETLTGLRIGGEKETFEVGGLDNPVIKVVYDKEKKVPIIPGSSVKGRMSILLEKEYGIKYDGGTPSTDNNKVEFDGSSKDLGERTHELFRSTKGVKLIFSDLLPTRETLEMWDELEKKEFTYDKGTEIKVENVINRETGTSASPRKMERVVRGSKFRGVVTLVYENENEKKEKMEKDLEILEKGFELISKTYIGGCGSRGYGRVRIKFNGKTFAPTHIE